MSRPPSRHRSRDNAFASSTCRLSCRDKAAQADGRRLDRRQTAARLVALTTSGDGRLSPDRPMSNHRQAGRRGSRPQLP